MKQILVFSLLLLTFSSLNAQSKNVLRFIEEYQSIAHENKNGNRFTLEKWEERDTLYYKIEGELFYLSPKNFKKYLAKIEGLSGITFTETIEREKADIIIFIGDLQDYFRYIESDIPNNLTNNFDNWNNRKYTPGKQLRNATFCVDPQRTKTPERNRYLIKRGILKSIGFWGQSEDDYSMFYKYNTKNNLRLSKNDKRVIKLHYNSSIKANMSVSESKETILKNIDIEFLLKQKL